MPVRFPRLPYRGLIEAVLFASLSSLLLHFRDFHIAASLKHFNSAQRSGINNHFRDFHIAASLKQRLAAFFLRATSDFRDFHIAASLKLCHRPETFLTLT